MKEQVSAWFPIVGRGFVVEMTNLDDDYVATLRIVMVEPTRREGGQQSIELLPAEHRSRRGLDYLAASVEVIRELECDELTDAMPSDLFLPEILSIRGAIDRGRVERVFADARARRIIDVSRWEERPFAWSLEPFLPTLDPATYAAPPCLTDPALEALIVAQPDDPVGYEIYGDWLSERGDPRGELIALQLQLKGTDEDSSIHSTLDSQLRRRYAYEWLGKLAWDNRARLSWRYGFVHGAQLSLRTGLDIISELTTCRSARFLSDLGIESYADETCDPMIAALVATDLPRTLRSLHIRARAPGSLWPLYSHIATVERLAIDVSDPDLGSIALPALRAFQLQASPTEANLMSLRHAALPRLESLVLSVKSGPFIDWIFDGAVPPTLVHLGLINGGADRLLDQLARSAILPRLRTVDLADELGTLTNAGLDIIRRSPERFAHLERLDLPQLWDPFTGAGTSPTDLPTNVRFGHPSLR